MRRGVLFNILALALAAATDQSATEKSTTNESALTSSSGAAHLFIVVDDVQDRLSGRSVTPRAAETARCTTSTREGVGSGVCTLRAALELAHGELALGAARRVDEVELEAARAALAGAL